MSFRLREEFGPRTATDGYAVAIEPHDIVPQNRVRVIEDQNALPLGPEAVALELAVLDDDFGCAARDTDPVVEIIEGVAINEAHVRGAATDRNAIEHEAGRAQSAHNDHGPLNDEATAPFAAILANAASTLEHQPVADKLDSVGQQRREFARHIDRCTRLEGRNNTNARPGLVRSIDRGPYAAGAGAEVRRDLDHGNRRCVVISHRRDSDSNGQSHEREQRTRETRSEIHLR